MASETFTHICVQVTSSTLQGFSLEFSSFITNKLFAYNDARYHVRKSPPLGPIFESSIHHHSFKIELNNIFHGPYSDTCESFPHHHTIHILDPF